MGACVYSNQGAIEKAWVKTLSSDLHSSNERARLNLQAYVKKTLTAIREVSVLKTRPFLCKAFRHCACLAFMLWHSIFMCLLAKAVQRTHCLIADRDCDAAPSSWCLALAARGV